MPESGCRVGEALGLRYEDIAAERETICVAGVDDRSQAERSGVAPGRALMIGLCDRNFVQTFLTYNPGRRTIGTVVSHSETRLANVIKTRVGY
jgi:hypothetical protein